MKRVGLYLLTVINILSCTGCIQLPHVNFNAQENTSIRSIAIIPPKLLKRVTIFYFQSADDALKMEKALVAAADFSAKMDLYNYSIFPAIFHPNNYFLSKLRSYLRAEGYRVVLLPYAVREESYLSAYPRSIADAFLDLRLGGIGYIANHAKAIYLPTARLSARLIEEKSNAILYDKHFAVGNNLKLEKSTHYLGKDMKYGYESFDTLNAQAIESVEGLKGALNILAKQIAYELRKSKKR